MRISGAKKTAMYGTTGSQVLAASYSNDTSLLTLGSSSSSDYLSSSSSGSFSSAAASAMFGSGGASGLFGSSGNPFSGAGSVFGAGNPTTAQSAVLINARRAKIVSTKTQITNLDSVTIEGVAKKSADYISQDKMKAEGFGLGSVLDKLA